MNLSYLQKTVLNLAAILVLLGAGLTTGHAQILFDNGTVGPGTAAIGEFFDANLVGGTSGGPIFTPTANGTANSISFSGFYAILGDSGTLPSSDAFGVALYSAVLPINIISLLANSTLSNITRTYSGFDYGFDSTQQIFNFSATIDTPFALNTSSTYFLGIQSTLNPSAEFKLLANSDTGPAPQGVQFSSLSSYEVTNPASVVFSVSEVPEPSTWALLSGGLALLGFTIRRRAL